MRQLSHRNPALLNPGSNSFKVTTVCISNVLLLQCIYLVVHGWLASMGLFGRASNLNNHIDINDSPEVV